MRGVYLVWPIVVAVAAVVSAELVYTALSITSWPLLGLTVGIVALGSILALRGMRFPLAHAIAVTVISLGVLAAIFFLYAHSVNNNLN